MGDAADGVRYGPPEFRVYLENNPNWTARLPSPEVSHPPLDILILLSDLDQASLAMLKYHIEATQPATRDANAWKETDRIVKNYSEELVDQWNKEIDGFLTFVGGSDFPAWFCELTVCRPVCYPRS